jgi:hypothetical protein
MSFPMRNTLVLTSALVLATGASAATSPGPATPDPPATPLSAPVYVLSGGGYGHGVGLNQYGALGQANANRTYKDILAFYYPGTTMTQAAISTVRVLIADGRPSVKIGSTTAFTVTDGHYARHLRRMRLSYAQRSVALARALRQQFGRHVELATPEGGLTLLAAFQAVRRIRRWCSMPAAWAWHPRRCPPMRLGMMRARGC